MILVPKAELERRLAAFRDNLTRSDDSWRVAFIFSKVNLYYFTGTMQNGTLCIPRDGEAVFFVRKSYDRALAESKFPTITRMGSFKDIPAAVTIDSKTVHVELEALPIAQYSRFNKYLGFDHVQSCDLAIAQTRAVKSPFELELMFKAGDIHRDVMDNVIPTLLREGISEAELGALTLMEAIKRGHQGITRMGSYNAELYLGNFCFGDHSNYYNSFDGPAGIYGVSPAVPLLGNHDRFLKKNEIVLIDMGCGYHGYHTDKTAIYSLGKLPQEAYDLHQRCVDIQNKVAEQMKPGAIPSEIYASVTADIDELFDEHFMGFGSNKVKFLGHGIGLVIDEYPVFAKGFNEPLVENTVMAVEPKRGIPGLGMVGTENTFVVTPSGGKSITGTQFDIITVE